MTLYNINAIHSKNIMTIMYNLFMLYAIKIDYNYKYRLMYTIYGKDRS